MRMFYIATVNKTKPNTAYALVMNPAKNIVRNYNPLETTGFFSLKEVKFQFQLPELQVSSWISSSV